MAAAMIIAGGDKQQVLDFEMGSSVSEGSISQTGRAASRGRRPASSCRRADLYAREHRRRERVLAFFDNLSGLARNLAAIEGQKHVVVMSEGFNPTFSVGEHVPTAAELPPPNAGPGR